MKIKIFDLFIKTKVYGEFYHIKRVNNDHFLTIKKNDQWISFVKEEPYVNDGIYLKKNQQNSILIMLKRVYDIQEDTS